MPIFLLKPPKETESMTTIIQYQDLVLRFGHDQAMDWLTTIEKLAQIQNDIEQSDKDKRLQQALEALNHINFAQ